MRDPVTLAIVSSASALVHARLLSTLHAALPRVGVLDPGVFACDLAGTEELLAAPPRRIRARRAWDDAIASHEQLVFALRVVVDEISAVLARDGLAALRLELRLDREDARPLHIERSVLPPTRESTALLRSLRWAL